MSVMPKNFYYKNNRLQQLRGFFYTAQIGSVTKAAAKMFLNQSTVSMQIQSLERDLNVKLFDRNGPKIVLTEEGKMLYSLVMPQIDGIDNIYERFLSLKEEKHLQDLRVGAGHITILYMLPAFLQKFMQEHEKVQVHLDTKTIKDGLQALLEDKLHLLIGTLSKVPEEFEFHKIKSYKPILMVHKDHKLAKKKSVTLNDIAKYPFIRMASYRSTIPTLDEIAKEHKFSSNITLGDGDYMILKKLVKAKIGNAIASEICIDKKHDDEIVSIDLSSYFPKITYGLVVRKGKYLLPQVRDFIKMLIPDYNFDDESV